MTLTLILGAIALVWLLKMIAAAMDEKGALLLAGWVLIAIVALAAYIAQMPGDGGGIGGVALFAGMAWSLVVAFVNLGPKVKAENKAEIDAEARRSADLRWKLDP